MRWLRISMTAILVALGGCMNKTSTDFRLPSGATSPWDPATEEEVQEIETVVGARLPDDYREFLLSVNGIKSGYPILVVSTPNPRASSGTQLYDLGTLWTASQKADETAQLLFHRRDYQFDIRAPKRLMIIGCTFGPEQYCISLSGSDRGHIFYWFNSGDDAQESEDLRERFARDLASSFRDFWSQIRASTDQDFE